ncbi:MAG: glycosyltransferase family protein [Caulobacteraceae bacterium]|nr:glycosyltransferase family protein [Caulobacteraceae bacterium]
MKILTVIQARMTSSRLPGKVMRPILDMPMMGRQIERLRRSQSLGQLVVATSVDPTDQVIADYCRELGCPTHRGPLLDVLGRYAEALAAFGPADHVVRLTADCPLADWTVIDDCIALHLASGADYTSNTVDRFFPRGLDVEVFRADLLPKIAAGATDPYDREHVTPFFYRNPDRFRIEQLVQEHYLAHLRWTVDRPDDFAFVTRVYETLYPAKPAFTTNDILDLGWTFRSDPDDPLQPAAQAGG